MNRRASVLALLALSVATVPPTAEAQRLAKVWWIGLSHVGLDHVPPSLGGVREGLKSLGYEDGENIRLD